MRAEGQPLMSYILYSNIGGYVLHVLPLESLRGRTAHNSWLVMSISSHSSVWFDEKKIISRKHGWSKLFFFLNGLIDKFFANWIVMLLKAVYFMTNFSNHITTTKIPLLSLFCLKL